MHKPNIKPNNLRTSHNNRRLITTIAINNNDFKLAHWQGLSGEGDKHEIQYFWTSPRRYNNSNLLHIHPCNLIFDAQSRAKKH